ncbi:hypothetical protein A33Q_2851 [Indibacter alkaliphilus LW1]|uniref:Uncharacterized protein n=1 Tax=Indibacter alkaliphilus (strain CCUG 57479 / KCTC 22604 / LW1) TaxID=1189612 RepID=S2D9D2_INDAL|nr:hypothetical protein A33Q_2851 [Indibacter alkaliphilus LW1]
MNTKVDLMRKETNSVFEGFFKKRCLKISRFTLLLSFCKLWYFKKRSYGQMFFDFFNA